MVTGFVDSNTNKMCPSRTVTPTSFASAGQSALDATVRLVAGPQESLNQLRRELVRRFMLSSARRQL
jgi:hypothetical protein